MGGKKFFVKNWNCPFWDTEGYKGATGDFTQFMVVEVVYLGSLVS